MRRRRLGFGSSSAVSWSLGIALVAACNVYDSSLLTGGAAGQGGTSASGTGSGGHSGTGTSGTAGKGGAQGGGTGGTSGTGMDGGDGGTDATGGTGTGGDTGGSTGGSSGGTTGGSGKGGSAPTGGDAGDTATGGKGGSSTGGSSMGGMGGDGGSGPSGGSGANGGSGGNAGSGGACGKCGCGKAETGDTDGDGVLDCNDMCPGFDDAHCAALKSGLVHRYSFGGTGTTATDSKGTSNGTILNASLTGTGSLTLTGGNTTSPPYVNLPNGIISSLTNATFEVWLTWNQSGTTGQTWQRIFDFGTTGTEDFAPNASPATTGTTYLFLTCMAGAGSQVLRGAFTTAGGSAELVVNAPAALGRTMQHHVALVVDDQNNQLTLYLDGAPQAALLTFSGQLSQLTDVNNWLGRSQYSADPELLGVYNEFRIYNVALTAQQISTSFMAGPDATFF